MLRICPLTLGCQIELADPFFNEDWFYLRNRIITPLRFNVISQPRTVLARGPIPFRKLLAHVFIDESSKGYMSTRIVPVDCQS
ncbi:MAG: hypothetical protein AUI02_03665 [Acidobacteria bacterium 13_2_20CM_2_57_12]|nr:MAG: hypothetical protein AUH01_01755 [Acidobacteria bacterium 13_2_20CM_56_17]OLB95384.1 MAG: hypothetical protein AUI02_03665 [Acidobacteria bacterium 13_2_20CM_2_57_12]